MTASARIYDLYIDGAKLGTLRKDDTFILSFGEKSIILEDVSGLPGVAAKISFGLIPTFAFTLYDVDTAFLFGTVLGDYATVLTSGANKLYQYGTRRIDLKALAKPALIHPSDLSLTDRNDDINLHLASINPEGLELKGSETAFQESALSLVIFPDNDRDANLRYMTVGDPSITNTPLAMILTMNRKISNVPKTLTALTTTVDPPTRTVRVNKRTANRRTNPSGRISDDTP